MEHIRPAQWPAWFAQQTEGPAPMVLDVREPWEIQTAAIKADGFEVLVMPMGEIPARLAELDPTRPIACLCHHGVRSLRVANFLAQNGFERLANITGGIDAWSIEADPTVPRY